MTSCTLTASITVTGVTTDRSRDHQGYLATTIHTAVSTGQSPGWDAAEITPSRSHCAPRPSDGPTPRPGRPATTLRASPAALGRAPHAPFEPCLPSMRWWLGDRVRG